MSRGLDSGNFHEKEAFIKRQEQQIGSLLEMSCFFIYFLYFKPLFPNNTKEFINLLLIPCSTTCLSTFLLYSSG